MSQAFFTALAQRGSGGRQGGERPAIILQVQVLDAEDYPRRFLCAVSGTALHMGLERSESAVEGMADSGTLGGAVLSALKRLSMTGHAYPFAWTTLGAEVWRLGGLWLAAGFITPAEARVVARGALVVTTEATDPAWRQSIVRAGGEVTVVAPGVAGGVDLQGAMASLAERDVHRCYAEPGAALAAALLANDVVDELVLHVADGARATARPTPAVAIDELHLAAHRPRGADREWRYRRPGPA